MKAVLTTWAGYLSAAAIATYFAVLLPLRPHPAQGMTVGKLLDHWNRWDAYVFYLPIVKHGYTKPIDATFFPGYPAIVHVLWTLTGKQHLVADALAISALGLLLALFGLAALARQLNIPTPLVLLLTLTASPVAFFLVAPYPTSLLLAILVWSLYFARRTTWTYHWYAAAGLALLAPLVHLTGLALWPALVVEFIVQHRGKMRELLTILQGAVVLFSAPVGLGIWCAYTSVRYHDPLAWLHQEQVFGHIHVWPWQTIWLLWQDWQHYPSFSYGQARLLIDALPLMLSALLFAWAISSRSLPASFYVLWALLLYATIASPVVGMQIDDAILSAGRYLLPAVPATLFLAMKAKEPRYQTGLLLCVALCSVLQVVCLGIYLNGGWIV
jgi:hypothetical protein